jgi:acyl-coenzyme A thioesterase PaaI-like protein
VSGGGNVPVPAAGSRRAAPAGLPLPPRWSGAPPPGADLGPHNAGCFACGDQPGGLRLRIRAGEGLATSARLVVGPQHQGTPGLAHGGILQAALAEALGSVLWLLGRPAVTRRMETDFLRPVPVGCTLAIDSRCVGVAGRKIYLTAEARIDGAPDQPAVRADAVFLVVDRGHFRVPGGRDAASRIPAGEGVGG